ncbi:MerR family transcriptional regulator [Marinicrinis lubricantis]|uniref:MerR family transcriptional regulator n=1 Tax=Marinicrinis lubricantis TaxID=2086470 RepID=A0ABW1IQ13_9BACL
MKEALFSIGEVAKLANISIKALRYYDQMGLFKPAYVDPETNYRYYHDSQLYHLDLIKSLRYIGTPLEEIKKAQELNRDELIAFLTEQENKVREQIEFLLDIEQTISIVKRRMMKQLEDDVNGEVYISNDEEMRIIRADAEGMTPLTLLNASYSKLIQYMELSLGFIHMSYGATFPFAAYGNVDEITYRHIFTPVLSDKQISTMTPDLEVITIPSGTYACISFIFSVEHYFDRLQKLFKYIDNHQFTVLSDIYEFFSPIHYSPRKQEEFLVEMKVRILEPSE